VQILCSFPSAIGVAEKEIAEMATYRRRRNRDGSTSHDVTVRVTGYPSQSPHVQHQTRRRTRASRTEAAAKSGTLAVTRGMTFATLVDEGLPRLKNPTQFIFACWREAFGDLRLDKITPELIAAHRDRLLGACCRGHGHRTSKPRSGATVRNYLIELSRLFTLAVRELRVTESNPVQRIKKPPASRQIVRFLSDEERVALLAACKASESPDLYLFVLFAVTTGARKGEIASLEWTRVNKLVFPFDVTTAWHTAIARAGITDFRFHDLRHSCAPPH
jgi:integrase